MKLGLINNPKDINISNEEQAQKVLDIRQRREDELVSEKLKEEESKMTADVSDATADPNVVLAQSKAENRLLSGLQESDSIGVSLDELDRDWLGEIGNSFVRGVGQSISATGDLVNMVASVAPWWNLKDGVSLGNALNDLGDQMDEEHRTWFSDKVKQEEITLNSFTDPDFWKVHVAETIPLMLEFLMAGKGFSSLGTRAASKGVKSLGSKTLSKYGAKTVLDSELLSKGVKRYFVPPGGSRGFGAKLFTDMGEATNLTKQLAGTLSAGLSQNLMAGAMNGMELYKQMAEENEFHMERFGELLYTEDEMARAAAGTFTRNMEYLLLDTVSWGVTFGKMKNPISQSFKETGDLIQKTSSLFASKMNPIARALTKASGNVAGKALPVAGKAVFEGIEETFQETFEEWAKLRSKAVATGKDWNEEGYLSDYFSFYMSDENRATIVLSAAAGGLMGGAVNIREAFNKNAEEFYNQYDRQQMLKTKLEIHKKYGDSAREWAMESTIFDIANSGKEELFEAFVEEQIKNGVATEEEREHWNQLYEEAQKDIALASSLNTAGKREVSKSSYRIRQLKKKLDLFAQERDQKIEEARENFSDDTESFEKAAESINETYNEQMDTVALELAMWQSRRANLLTGEKSSNIASRFVVSRDGTEFYYTPEEIANIALEDTSELNLLFDGGFVVGGMTEQEYQMYREMNDDQLAEHIKNKNKKALSGMSDKIKSFYDKIRSGWSKKSDKKDKAPEENEEQFKQNYANKRIEEGIDPDVAIEEANKAWQEKLEESKKKEESETSSPEEESEPQADNQGKSGTETSKKKNNALKGKEVPALPKRRENENEYEKDAIENEDYGKGKETLAEKKARETKEAEEEFAKRKLSKDSIDEDTGTSKEEAPEYTIDKNKDGKIVVKDKSGETLKTKTGRERVFASPKIAKKAIDELSRKKGKHSKAMGDTETKSETEQSKSNKKGTSKIKGIIEKALSANRQPDKMSDRQLINFRRKQAEARRSMIYRELFSDPKASAILGYEQVTAPTADEYNNYVNSVYKKMKYGPNEFHQQEAMARSFKARGLNINVISLENLYDAVGTESVGYALGNTLFIDAAKWNQKEVLMHEAVHLYYPLVKDHPVGRAVIKFGLKDKKKVEEIKAKYPELIQYSLKDPNGNVIIEGTAQEILDHINERVDEENKQNMASFYEALLDENPLVTELPIEQQEGILEEVFAYTLQGPLSKRLNHNLERTQESKRQEVSKSFWSFLKESSLKDIDNTKNVIKALNDGNPVSEEDLFDFVADGLADALANNDVSTTGKHSKISSKRKADVENLKRINDTKNKAIDDFNYNEFAKKAKKSLRDRTIQEIKKQVSEKAAQNDWTQQEADFEEQILIEEFENSFYENGGHDYDMLAMQRIKGATRVLNGFVRSLNYVRRQKHVLSKGSPKDLKLTQGMSQGRAGRDYLLDREELISEFYNLALETRGNTGLFIQAIKDSKILEISEFYNYLSKVHPEARDQILHDMAFLMGNLRVIQAVKSYNDKNGNYVLENALAERELHQSENKMRQLMRLASDYRKSQPDSVVPYEQFSEAMNRIRNRIASNSDYLYAMKFLFPAGIHQDKILKEGYINLKGNRYPIERVLNSLARNPQNWTDIRGKEMFKFNAETKTFLNAIVDTDRKNTSRSVVMNALGNNTSSRITNNFATTTIDEMIKFLSTKKNGKFPSYASFKRQFGNVLNPNSRTVRNPVLENFYKNFVGGKSLPTMSQYLGNNNQRSQKKSEYKSSDAFTQTIEDFLMFNNKRANGKPSAEYLQFMGPAADSPRKFMITAPRLSHEENFSKTGLSRNGKNLLRAAYEIHSSLSNQGFPNYESFEKMLFDSIAREKAIFEENGLSLSKNAALKPYFDNNGKLNKEGHKAIEEFVFNNVVNGLAISEIFNPSIAFRDITKRNKGVFAPVMSTGNENLRQQIIYINDDLPDGGTNPATDSGQFMLESSMKKITRAGQALSPFNNGIKAFSYHVEKENENFANRTAMFKGNITPISDDTLKSEEGLRPVYELLSYMENEIEAELGDLSNDAMDGDVNVITVVHPKSSIKSDLLTPEQQKKYAFLTYDFIREAYQEYKEWQKESGKYEPEEGSKWKRVIDAQNEINRDKNGKFVGLSAKNFGPQQVFDKIRNESNTPIQLMGSLLAMNNNQQAENIQRLLRQEMDNQLEIIKNQIKGLSPENVKKFLLSRFDLEAMDQTQRLMLENDVNSLDHTSFDDFVNNTLVNIIKSNGNKLKTFGEISKQKPSLFYEYPNKYYTKSGSDFSNRIKWMGDRTINTFDENGNEVTRTGSRPGEIVLPAHKKGTVKERTYIRFDQLIDHIGSNKAFKDIRKQYNEALANNDKEKMLELTKKAAGMLAYQRHKINTRADGFGNKMSDFIDAFYNENGDILGYYVAGEYVLATRIPSDGPHSTGVFEVVDFLSGPGNDTVVSEEFSGVVGSDYDGDNLFIQQKDKKKPLFNKAMDEIIQMYMHPDSYSIIREEIEFEGMVKKVLKNIKFTKPDLMPMSPEYNRDAYNNTMVSKRSIGKAFNVHRLANYLAAYQVGLSKPIQIGDKVATSFNNKPISLHGETKSRTTSSAIITNIILDNSKWHYADALGINDTTLTPVMLLTNLGFNLEEISSVMNTRAVKTWSKHLEKSNSPYLTQKKISEIKKDVIKELSLGGVKSTGINIDLKNLESPQNERAILELLSYAESINSEIMTISRVMSGHNNINPNPFLLENHINKFNELIENKSERQNLLFNDGFRNNPDVTGYLRTAQATLDMMKDLNKIYSSTSASIISEIQDIMNPFDGIRESQLERASQIIEAFENSRVLGLNNIPVQEKEKMKKELFDELMDYFQSLADTDALKDSYLFNHALNISIGNEYTPSYMYANPRFYMGDNSITPEEFELVKREFEELPVSIKEKMIVYDLLEHNLTGPRSLTKIFDDSINEEISTNAYLRRLTKNEPLSNDVKKELRKIIISNEFSSPDSEIPSIQIPKGKTKDFAKLVRNQAEGVWNRFLSEKGFLIKINDKPYYFSGINESTLDAIRRNLIGSPETSNSEILNKEIVKRIKPLKLYNDNFSQRAKSIADQNSLKRYKPIESKNRDGIADHILEATIDFESKKKTNKGKFFKIDYHNYNDATPLNIYQFRSVNEIPSNVSEEQVQEMYKRYLKEKAEANQLVSKINSVSVQKMTDTELKNAYVEYATKDIYAYSIITTPIIIEIANRAAIEQSGITKVMEGVKDMSLIDSWLNNNNITASHPATQALVRTIAENQKTFQRERAKYIKRINKATEDLYKSKFGYSRNRLIRGIQKINHVFFRDRRNVLLHLYGNLINFETITDKNGKTKQVMSLKDRKAIENLHKAGLISNEEYEFYNVFTSITKEFEAYSGAKGLRKNYIPHTSMNAMERFSNRGLMGLLVDTRNDKGLSDVKLYFEQNGKKELLSFNEIKAIFRAQAARNKNNINDIIEYKKIENRAKKLLKTGKNEDGSNITFSNVQNATLLDMSPMSRFSNSRSVNAEEMPSMDLNKALVDYVHTTLFKNGNGVFKGFQSLMPLIDGVFAYNDKKGWDEAARYVKDVIKEKFIHNRDQTLFGKKTDKVIKGLTYANLLYALGYKGFIVGKGVYAVGNIAIGKYMNIKREGGATWVLGERRYWGTDQGVNLDSFKRARRAQKILENLGFMEISLYDDVSMSKKTGLDSIVTNFALLPMRKSEDWIQKTHFLGLLTEEEFNKFDEDGNYKEEESEISVSRVNELEERVKIAHGKGYTPVDQSRIHTYALGRMFMQFSRHIPSNFRERFAREDVNMYGRKQIGSLRQFYNTVNDVFSKRMSVSDFKEYRESLEPHKKEALDQAVRGMALVALAGFITVNTDEGGKLSPNNISSELVGDANIYVNAEKMGWKTLPPAVRSAYYIMDKY